MYPKEIFKGLRQLEYLQASKYYSNFSDDYIVSYSCPLFFTYLVRVDFETMVLVLVETYRYKGKDVTKSHAWKFNYKDAIRFYTDAIVWYHRRILYLN